MDQKTKDKPSLLGDLKDIKDSVNQTAHSIDKFGQHATDALIGPAATQALGMVKAGLKSAGSAVYQKVFGPKEPTATVGQPVFDDLDVPDEAIDGQLDV